MYSRGAPGQKFVGILQRVCERLKSADSLGDSMVVFEVVLDDHAK